MLPNIYLSFGVIGAACWGQSAATLTGPSCRTPAMHPEAKQESRVAMAQNAANAINSRMSGDIIQIPTYFHVVAKSKSVQDGYLSRETMMKQIKQMNSDYADTGFNFTLVDIDWTINAQWASNNNDPKIALQMKKKLRKGNYNTLNMYFSNPWSFCTFPTNVQAGSDDFYTDGCSVTPDVVPGGSTQGWDQGKTASHEAGHWLFLYHTSENECEAPGDEVDDTPAEKERTNNLCPAGRDTCPQVPGLDPIHNHMGGGNDPCRTEFTPGQIERMHTAWETYRKGK